ncbi:MAG: ASKHA domain-containing protein [Candidatus Humimicrobiaceae bacterium]
MEKKKHIIKIYPQNLSMEVKDGYNLRQALLEMGINLGGSCGGSGTCGRCRVEILDENQADLKSKDLEQSKNKNIVLSCITQVKSDLEVLIPHRKDSKAFIEKGSFINKTASKDYLEISSDRLAEVEIKPWIIKKTISIQKPTLNYGTSDLHRLRRSIKENFDISGCIVPLKLLRIMPWVLRKENWKATITIDTMSKTLIDIFPGDSDKKIYGIALDIGTTTLVMYLADLETGEIINSVSEYNPQIKYGEDIINRIIFSGKKGGLEKIRYSIINEVNHLIYTLLVSAGVSPEKVLSMTVAGNSTMMHLFYGVSPKYIREEPYITVVNKFTNSTSQEVGIEHIKNAIIYNMPGVASYLGGDIVSGILATDISNQQELTLFIDLGTNGELAVGNKDWIMGCSASAGPAFEGGGVKCGIRAAAGAIDKVIIDGNSFKCRVGVLGKAKPIGICGSGLIDLIGEMYIKEVIDRKGKFNFKKGNKYFKTEEGEIRYIVVPSEQSGTGDDIYITEIDIDNLIRTKAAIYAGIKTLLEEVGLKVNDLDRIYVAGGMGRNLNIKNAIVLGMLPDIDIKKYYFVGNTAIAGTYLSLLSENKYKESLKIASKLTYLELSTNNNYMDRYVAGLFLPFTDFKEFPSVGNMIKEHF